MVPIPIGKLIQYDEILNFQKFYGIQYNSFDRGATQHEMDFMINDMTSDHMDECIQRYEEA